MMKAPNRGVYVYDASVYGVDASLGFHPRPDQGLSAPGPGPASAGPILICPLRGQIKKGQVCYCLLKPVLVCPQDEPMHGSRGLRPLPGRGRGALVGLGKAQQCHSGSVLRGFDEHDLTAVADAPTQLAFPDKLEFSFVASAFFA